MREDSPLKKLGYEVCDVDFEKVIQRGNGSEILYSITSSFPGLTILCIILIKTLSIAGSFTKFLEQQLRLF